MSTRATDEGVNALRHGVDLLLGEALAELSATELAGLLAELETVRRRLDAVDHVLVAAADQRSLAGEYARSNTADLLVNLLRVSPREARSRVTQAGDLGPRLTLQGEPLPPLLPATACAVELGELSTAHVSVITDCLEHVPSNLSPDVFTVVESLLVETARHDHPDSLRRTAALLLARLDQDGSEPLDDPTQRHREVSLTRYRDGSGRLQGRLTPEATAVWDTILDTLSAPAPAEDGLRDERTAGQRRHDGLLDAGHRLLRSGALAAAGGIPVTVLIRTTAADLANATSTGSGSAIATSGRGDVLKLRQLRTSLGDAELIPVRMGASGAVLDLGRTRRLAGRAQRLALAARDGGCTFPGCDRPATWAEVHHVIPWQDGGGTNLDNMCLVCRFHHREFERRGWRVQMSKGIPEWIPPSFIDPQQRPRRNTAHHPPDLEFDIGHVPAA